jgi:succinoglycan biosynthesis protein ExoL
MSVKIAYLVHDLTDPAVRRRVRMLRLGGADVALAGFRRGANAVEVEGAASIIELGRTEDAKMAARAASVLTARMRLGRLAEAVRGADAVLARNLEMLVLAARARDLYAPDAPLVYECLDIHRLLLSPALPGKLLRQLETRLLRRTDLLLTSSPGFVRNYFEPRGIKTPIRLVENKVFDDRADGGITIAAARPPAGPPWRIGWFGMTRCRRSLEALKALARGSNGAIEVIIRGRPSPAVFPDFEAEIAGAPGLSYHGPYRNPEDLAEIYGGVHFVWAIDYYEAGENSAWLLPGRLYEGSLYGAVPLALAGVETGRWLAQYGAGVLLEDPPGRQLAEFFGKLDAAQYDALAAAVGRISRRALVDGAAECRQLVDALCRCKAPVVISPAAKAVAS